MQEISFRYSGNYDEAIALAADECGVTSEYWDIFRKKHVASTDVRRRILDALGWDTTSSESIDRGRSEEFLRKARLPLQGTCVTSIERKSIPLRLLEGSSGTVSYRLTLEDGRLFTGDIAVSAMAMTSRVRFETESWSVFELPLPAEVPLGYHRLEAAIDGAHLGETNVILCPDRAYLPDKLASGGRLAGFNVALYGLRSDRNWGCGDLTDLRGLVDWAHKEVGFGFIGLNPLHALHNRVPYNTSPYLPLSIYYKNLIYVDVESVPEFRTSRLAQCLIASPAIRKKIEDLRNSEFVQYHEVDRTKRRFLRVLYRDLMRSSPADSLRRVAFSEYCSREGDLLYKFALYCALDEILHKQDRNRWTWQHWPAQYHDPNSQACQDFAQRYRRTVEFFKYVQFVLDEQLFAAQEHAKGSGMSIGIYHDLAVATDGSGSDLWAHPEFYVSGCRVGAPPDDFNPNGQDWAFPPPNVIAHQKNGYQLFRQSISKIVRHGGALRIDHVMRLFRLYWVPEGVEAARGTYVLDRANDLMRILALESVRSRNVIIGEDLGTVTDEIRDTLSRFGILSYRLFYFEKHDSDQSFKRTNEYPAQALVASSTHDLPTLSGFWIYRDIESRKHAGLIDDHAYWQQRNDRRREKQRMLDALHAESLLPSYYARDADQIPELDGELHNAIMSFLAKVPSMILLINQEDFTKETEQQNLPGSTAEYPNWQRKMKVKLEELRSPEWQPYAAMFRNQLERNSRIDLR